MSVALGDKVQEIRRGTRAGQKKRSRRFAYSGRILCETCGRPLRIHTFVGARAPALECDRGCIPQKSTRFVDATIVAALQTVLQEERFHVEVEEYLKRNDRSDVMEAETLALVQKEKRDLLKKINRGMGLLFESTVADLIEEKLRTMRTRLLDLEEQIRKLEGEMRRRGSTLQAWAQTHARLSQIDIPRLWYGGTLEWKREVLRDVFETIEMRETGLIFTTPTLPKSPRFLVFWNEDVVFRWRDPASAKRHT